MIQRPQDGNELNEPQSGNATKYSANTAAENMAVETANNGTGKKIQTWDLTKKRESSGEDRVIR